MSGGYGKAWRDIGNDEKDLYDLAELHRRSSDAFDKIIADGTTNELDIPSIYNFNAERYRAVVNGTKFRDISGITQITDREGDILVEPGVGDDIIIQTAERPRYVVGYEAAGTWSGQIEQGLDTGDQVKMGLSDFQNPENAAYFEFNGDGTYRAVLVKDDTEVTSETFSLPGDLNITDKIRYEIKFNWYGAGSFKFKIFYTDDDAKKGEKEQNVTVAELSKKDEQSTNDSNFKIFQEIDAATTGKDLKVGSFGYNVLGTITATNRSKKSRLTGLTYDGTNSNYEAVAAMRIDPDQANVFTQLTKMEVVPDSGDGELLAVSVDPDQTNLSDSDFNTPVQHSERNSVIEEATDAGGADIEFPDSGGVQGATADNPNGYQVAFAASDASTQGSGGSRLSSDARTVRPVYEDDYVIFLFKRDSGQSTTINMIYETVQNW